MKLRQISFKIISLIMVFTMMIGMSATTISAVAEGIDSTKTGSVKTELNYVSIGDSMTNGYGFKDYNQAGSKSEGYAGVNSRCSFSRSKFSI